MNVAELAQAEKLKKFSVVSFFCGCGGLDLGVRGDFSYHDEHYESLPFDIKAAYDSDEPCIETYNRYFGQHGQVRDLSTLSRKGMKTEIDDADMLIGGFPCQPFSSCGPQDGLTSERGQLYKVMTSYMRLHRPKVVIGENVINLLRMEEGRVLKTILRGLRRAGYKVKVWNLFAPDYGIPQNRDRIFFICVRKDIPGFPEEPLPKYVNRPHSIEWAIGDLVKVTDESIPNQSQFFSAAKAKNGNGQGDETSIRDKPAYTIRANPKSRVQFHYELNRRLTVRECARIQTFPDDFVFTHSMTTSISQIGNAVPPVLGHIVASAVADFMKGLED